MKKKLFALLLVLALTASCEPVGSSSQDDSSTIDSSPQVSSSVEDSSVDSSVEEPVTISITNEDLNVWYDETLQLTYELSRDVELTLNWNSSNEEVATVSETGLVTPVKAGEVTITVVGEDDETVTDSVVVTVKDVIIDTAYGFGNFDYSDLKSENPTISTTKDNADWPYAETVFKNVYGQKYYAEATFNVTEINYGWTWNRISVGHRDRVEHDPDHFFRGLQLSYGDESGNQKKTVIMETPNNWGVTTDRSQVWGLNDLKTIDFTNVKLATLRDGNSYYYFINDVLYWVEQLDTRFLDVDTMPTIVVGDMHATISNLFATDDASFVDAKLAEEQTNRKLFPTYKENVIISENDTKIQFVNNNNDWPFTNIKDNRAVSLGDALRLDANVNGKIEFDLTFDEFGDNELATVGVTLHRWEVGPNNARTFAIQKYRAGLNSWDHNGDMPTSLTVQAVDFGVEDALTSGTTYHVVLERIVDGDTQTFKMSINGTTYDIDFSENYTGALTISIGATFANATIENLTVSSVV